MGSGAWQVTQGSTGIVVEAPDGSDVRSSVRASRDAAGLPALKPGWLAHIDHGALRPDLRTYLCSGAWADDDTLAPLLPLDHEESLALLRRRAPLCWQAVVLCVPMGSLTEREVGDVQKPYPRSRETIRDRKRRGYALIAAWRGVPGTAR